LQLLNKLLEDGNVLFKREMLSEAIHRYEYALRRWPADCNFPDGLNLAFDRLRVHLLLNLSRCKRKGGQTDKAVSLAEQVLELQPHCFEAFYAKAKAHREAGDLRAALADLAEAVRVAPQNREANRVLIRIRQDIAAAEMDAAKAKRCADSADSSSGVDSIGSVGAREDDDVETSLVI
jgi:tetratricopeptide (TPR) repeat protein